MGDLHVTEWDSASKTLAGDSQELYDARFLTSGNHCKQVGILNTSREKWSETGGKGGG